MSVGTLQFMPSNSQMIRSFRQSHGLCQGSVLLSKEPPATSAAMAAAFGGVFHMPRRSGKFLAECLTARRAMPHGLRAANRWCIFVLTIS